MRTHLASLMIMTKFRRAKILKFDLKKSRIYLLSRQSDPIWHGLTKPCFLNDILTLHSFGTSLTSKTKPPPTSARLTAGGQWQHRRPRVTSLTTGRWGQGCHSSADLWCITGTEAITLRPLLHCIVGEKLISGVCLQSVGSV